MGSSHAVCQDYALAGALLPPAHSEGLDPSPGPYVILSDGCSSSPDTDIGARLLARAAERLLRGDGEPQTLCTAETHREAARLALSWAGLLGLRPQAVDATLLTARLEGDELVVGCSGDGVVCLQTWTGELEVYSINYPSGYPLYPAYAHQPGRLLALEAAGSSCKEVRRFRSAAAGDELRLCDTSGGDSPTEVFNVAAADYRCVALFSDGIHSFYHTGPTCTGGRVQPVPLESVLPDLVSFKSTRGSFVGRRLTRFLKDCQRRGWRHADDLSIGALHAGG
jgi:hypothetical protein